MKWIGILGLCLSLLSGYVGWAATYEGVIVQDVQIACVTAPELLKLIQKNITIQPGEPFSQEKIRESIRNIYALERFSQVLVEAEPLEAGIRLSFCPVQLNRISKIQITGNRAIPEETIRNELGVNISNLLPANEVQNITQRVLKLYERRGYHQAQVSVQTLEESGLPGQVLVIQIQQGKASRIGTVTFAGYTVFSEEELLDISRLQPGKRFTRERIDEGIDRVKQAYIEKGYFDVVVTEQDATYHPETGTADLHLTVIEGTPTYIRFSGNTHFSTEQLQDMLSISSGNLLQEKILEEQQNALIDLYQAQGFAFVKVTYQQAEENGAPVILFVLEEGPRVQIEEIIIEGNQAFSAKQLQENMLTTTGGLFAKGFYQEKVLQEDIAAIEAFYQQEHGYLEAKVVAVSKEFSPDLAQVSLILVVEEGGQTRIAEIHIKGESDEATLKKIRKALAIKTGEPLNITAIGESIAAVRDVYANQGYLNGEIDVQTEPTEDKQQVSVTFYMVPGKRFYVGKILIQGVVRTKKHFITRELQVKEGDVYNPQKIRETVRRLHQLGLYDSVKFRRLDTKSQEAVQDMLLEVSETTAKDVEFGFGFSSELGLRGFAEYADKNVLNLGGKGSARAEMSIDRPKLTLQYLHPHFGTQDTQLVASVFNEMQLDNSSFDLEKRGGRLGVRHHFDKSLSLSVGYYFEQADPSNVKKAAKLSSLDTAVLNLGGVDTQLFWDVRDDVIQPKKGGVAQLYLRSATDRLGSETNFFEVRAHTSWYLRVLGASVLACSLSGHLIEPTQSSEYVPIYTRYFLGGDNSVRGFDKHEIGPKALNDETDPSKGTVNVGGDRLLRLNTEFRFPIYSVVGGVVFYDAGANWLNKDGFDPDFVRDAIGGGLRIATPVGPLRLDYGWKLDRKSGESPGEYYITIGSAF